MREQWDKIFKEQGKVFIEPHPKIPEVIELFKKRGIKRVLDLGCGSGRHLVYLAKQGFKVHGIDIAKSGIKFAKKWLKEEKLKANLKIGNIFKKLPYKNDFFDALISIRVINHGKIKEIRKLIQEIERVLKSEGLIFIATIKSSRKKEGLWKYKVIEPRTIIPLSGEEKGLPHYYFNRQLIRKEFKNFKIDDIWVDFKDSRSHAPHYVFLGELKKK